MQIEHEQLVRIWKRIKILNIVIEELKPVPGPNRDERYGCGYKLDD